MTYMAEITRAVRSHSQLSTYLQCPREYQLGRVEHVRRRPGAWFPGGTATHKVIELYLRHALTEEETPGA
jgi:PD-(D/E)XK nuclease superfamily